MMMQRVLIPKIYYFKLTNRKKKRSKIKFMLEFKYIKMVRVGGKSVHSVRLLEKGTVGQIS